MVTEMKYRQKTNTETEKQTIQKTGSGKNRENGGNQHDQQIIQNAVIFADDTKLLSEEDTHEQMDERMGNYDIATETRHLTIQWGKVHLLRKDKNKLQKALPPPFGKIKHQNSGTILGKDISMIGSLKNAATQRIAKAHQTWKQIHFKLLRPKQLPKG